MMPGPGCDATSWGAAPTVLQDGTCRCVVCARCGHHTGNGRQGHWWASCKVLSRRVRLGLAPGEVLSAAEFLHRTTREFHFCCPDPEFGCELEAGAA